jgi:hypothetical protein
MSILSQRIQATIDKYRGLKRKHDPVELTSVEDNRLRVETDNFVNIRLNKVENGWVITTTHQLKDNYEMSNRVVPEGGDVMAEIEQAIALHKLRM